MAEENTTLANRVIVEVSPDRLQAHIHLDEPGNVTNLQAEEVAAALQKDKIVIDDAVRSRIDEFVALADEQQEIFEPFFIAEGQPVYEGKDGVFIWNKAFEKERETWQDDAAINYYNLNSIITVEEGAQIGEIIPPEPPKNGVDVHGQITKPKLRPTAIKLGENVEQFEEDSPVVISKAAGRIIDKGNSISISETFNIKGDVDFESGSIESSVDVFISGTVRDLFEVKSNKSITVRGAIEAALVEAKEDITVRGGVLAHQKGKLKAGGKITVKFCEEADLYAIGDIQICKEAMGSKVHTEERLRAARGAIIGGNLHAREGAEIATLGSEAGIPTYISVGMHPNVAKEAARITKDAKAKYEAVEKIKKAVEPLVANIKRLTAEQKEQATELLYKAQDLEEKIAEMEKQRDEMVENARAKNVPSVIVSKTMHEGVTIEIGRRQTKFHKELKGPLRIEKRKIENVTEFVIINQLTGSINVLPSEYVVDSTEETAK